MRFLPVYYSVFALKDGTVITPLPTRKPRKTKYSRAPKIDEEGIWRWYLEKRERLDDVPDRFWTAFVVNVGTCLNVKRIVRQRVESRLDSLNERLDAMRSQLDRIERKLDERLSSSDKSHG